MEVKKQSSKKIKIVSKVFHWLMVAAVTLAILIAAGTTYRILNRLSFVGKKTPPKLLILGMDGANWEVINPLMEAGKMPNLKKLIEEGVSARPKTLNPTISPAIWTTVATGKVPEKHGIRNFLSTAKDYENQFIGSDARNVKALWNIFSEAGLKVGLFSWWATWPAEDINGYTVTDLSILDPERAISPEGLKDGILRNTLAVMGFEALKGGYKINLPRPTSINDQAFFETASTNFTNLLKLFNSNSLYAYDREDPDVLMQIYGGTDAVQHLFFKFLFPDDYPETPDQTLVEKYRDYIPLHFIAQDALLGEYLERAGPETNIIVMSDHGFFLDPAVGLRFKQFSRILNELGYLTFDSDGNIDFSKTIAFECNNNNFDWQRRLCINVEGRYSNAPVAQSDYNSTRSQIISDLKKIVTTKGEPLFNSVVPSVEINSDVQYDIRRDMIEEVILIGKNWRTVREYLDISVESGNHYSNPVGPDGIFVWKGPKIVKGKEVKIDYVDMAPNILYALDLPIAKDMDGGYLPELFVEGLSEPQYIESYETAPKTVALTLFESIEESDGLVTDGLKGYIHSTIKANDSYDNYCFFVPEIDNYALKVNAIENFRSTSIEFTPYDNPKILNPVDFDKFFDLKDLPIAYPVRIPLDTLRFPRDQELNYNIIIPLDLLKPSFLGLWTNTSFNFDSPSGGTLRLVARGEPADGAYPQLLITNNSSRHTLTINSPEFARYDVPVEQGPVTISYINDAKSASQDRNIYIQQIFVYENGVLHEMEETRLLRYGNDFCFNNTLPGTTEFSFELLSLKEPTQHPEASAEALELLEETGEIE